MKKVIVHVINSKSFSGLENVACQIINNLESEYDFYYVTQDGDILKVLREKKINYYVIEKMSISEIRQMIEKLNPSIIHAHDFRASVICALATSKVPIISHLHNNSPWLKNYCVNSFLYLYAGLKAKKIFLVSDSIRDEYVFSYFMKDKMITISNPVSQKSIVEKIDTNQLEKNYDICCVARITPQKNIYKFISVIKSIKEKKNDIKVVWVGTGEQETEFRKLIEDNDLVDNITLVGFQKNPYRFMAQSKIFLLTSDWEGYGLVAFEALSLGLPCVVSNIGGLPNIVDENCGMLCNINNISEYTKELEKLLIDTDYYLRKHEHSVLKAKCLSNQEAYFNKIREEYEVLL